MSQQRLHAAVAAGVLGVEARHSDLLQSIVDVARAIFGARAASIMFYDVDQHELVFEAVSGEGHDSLVGQRIPAGTGIAGWVLASQEPMVVEDVTANPSFSLATAESTGYVPKGLMAVPLLLDGDTLGVLNVLDRPARTKFSVEEMDLLGSFAHQASLALSVVHGGRRAQRVLDDMPDESAAIARLARILDGLEGTRRDAARRLLDALNELLAP
jgi:GAF domain-containing protein